MIKKCLKVIEINFFLIYIKVRLDIEYFFIWIVFLINIRI